MAARTGGADLKFISIVVCPLLLVGLAQAGVNAQTGDPVSAARLRLGPVGITPGVTVSAGTDSNVFAEETNPKSDFVTIVSPHVQMWLRARRLILDVESHTDAVNFSQYDAQGGINTRNEVRLELPLNRVRLSVANSFASLQQRVSPDIDARARRHTNTFTAGADIHATAKSYVRVAALRSHTEFDDNALNLGVRLAETLNRQMFGGTAAWRYQVTGATTITVSADAIREEFEFSTDRDSTSLRIAPGVEFDPRAIISGRAYVGYRRFDITSGLAQPFSGPVAAAELSSTIRETTRLSVQINRDVAYSYDVATPYYVLDGGGAAIGQRLGERWEVRAQASRQRLGYRGAALLVLDPDAEPVAPVADRKDYFYSYGAGVNYLFNANVRFGVNVDRSVRESGLVQRGYEGTRIVAQFGYGP